MEDNEEEGKRYTTDEKPEYVSEYNESNGRLETKKKTIFVF